MFKKKKKFQTCHLSWNSLPNCAIPWYVSSITPGRHHGATGKCSYYAPRALHLTDQAAMAAPNSAERKACWDARDQLWKCLDDNGDKAASCQKFQSEFEANCPAQWVKYFTKRRDFLKYKEKMQTEGFMPAEGPQQPS
ncbi:cytochrome c oxidase assembly factor 6 homolog isoform X1 [Perca flavescens]|uniref:cytochrome c oxidase assembly factor 6 homolog isoform X1 n=2 Tax=Perca flavescens TaxID=8167 RepID=UPI00106EE6F2|nr:cytochrome c oxidase assembly factor 6 homolog isoform X1 [Perca flavescens]